MAFLNRAQVKTIVRRALSEVADFGDQTEIEGFQFEHFHNFHISVFTASIKKFLNEEPYRKRDGTISSEAYYDIVLNKSIVEKWKFISDCIDYITTNHSVNPSPSKLKITFN